MVARIKIFPIILFFIVFLPFNLIAEKILGDNETDREPCDRAVCEDVCELVKNDLERGVDTKTVIKTNILLGNDACLVIMCALDSGAELKPVIIGAIEAGCMPDVVSRCCLNAGAQPLLVAQSLQSLAEPVTPDVPGDDIGPEDVLPVDTEQPGTSPGGMISPSSF